MSLFTKKEVAWILISIVILWFITGIIYNVKEDSVSITPTLPLLLVAALIIGVSVLAKKFAAGRYSAKIEHTVFGFQRWGFYGRSHFKNPIPMGIILPFFLAILSLGLLKPFTFLQFDAKNDPAKRLTKRQGTRRAERKSEINEVDIAFISAYGFYSLLILAIIGSLLNNYLSLQLGAQLTKYCIYFGLWNLLPWGNLDGGKTFYGSLPAYTILIVLYLIGLIFVIF